MTASERNRNRSSISRRTFLHGAGVTMALPWLESLPVWGTERAPGGAAMPYPRRFATLFMACGINPDHWWAKGAGATMELSKSLEPMAALKAKMNVIDGLFNKNAFGVGIHPGQTGNILSGASLRKGAELRGGVSMDQVLAKHIGHESVQPCLVLGCEQPITGYHETNFSMAYSSFISWRSDTSPVPMEVYPSLAFDSLFDNRGQRRNRSILDRVGADARSLCRQLSATDRARLDEYLDSVREIEKRVTRERVAKAAADKRSADRPINALPRPDNGMPADIREHMRLMCDIVALGFQTDKTRVATLLLCRDLSGLVYPFLNVPTSHHHASHSDRCEDYERIARYYVRQLAYLAGRLDTMREGDGTVLDHSCLLFLSNMYSGTEHDNSRLPLLLVGGLGGTLETGRVLDYRAAGDERRKLCSLYLSIMDRMGVRRDQFGDADAHLDRL